MKSSKIWGFVFKGSSRLSFVWVLAAMLCLSSSVSAQSAEVKQLLLNVEKLAQMKNILSDMKRGYLLISSGYNAVSGIAKGNFSLHEAFLDGLMLVSPEVRKYHKVAGIIRYQKLLVSEYQSAFSSFSASEHFSASELGYVSRVYQDLLALSLNNLDELVMVITSAKLRMSDAERLAAIDRIFLEVEDKLLFLRDFNKQGMVLSNARGREAAEINSIGGWYKWKK